MRLRPAVSLVLLGTALFCCRALVASDPRPTWECLPDDTAFMLRLPDPAGFLATLRGGTKLGAVVLDEGRLARVWRLLLDTAAGTGDDGDGFGEAFTRRLARQGLEPGDLAAVFRGDMGVAATLRPLGEGRPPLVVMLGWLEPGPDVAARLVEAAKRQFEDRQAEQSGQPSKRRDVEMAGHEVTWFTEPALGVDPRALDDDDDEAGQDAAAKIRRLRERIAAAEPVQVGLTHSFVTRIGGRLLVGQTLPPDGPPSGADAPQDFDALSGTDEARATFESFLAAHAGTGPAPVAEIMHAAAVRAALPAGAPLVEAVLDPRVVLAAYGDDAATRRRLAQTGLDALGPVAWRQSFAEGCCRGGVFVTLPAPRRGLAALLDQPCDAAEVPSFVGRDVTDFTQISLDLAAAYGTVREFAAAVAGEQAVNLFTAAEMQTQGWLGLDLGRVLGSFGSRHWLVTYASNVADALAEARQRRSAEGRLETQLVDRIALVWQVTDEAPFLALLGRLAPLAGGELMEEQGFRGLRAPGGTAAHVGHGHFVIASARAVETTLAAIRNPPAGEASLRESDVVTIARELVPSGPARVFSVSDSRQSGGTLGIFRDLAAGLRPEDVSEEQRPLLRRVQALLPSAAEMEGTCGVGTLVVEPAAAGITCRFAWQLPPQ